MQCVYLSFRPGYLRQCPQRRFGENQGIGICTKTLTGQPYSNMKTNRVILFFCLVTLGFTSCEKRRFDEEVFYEQTFCSDDWGYGRTDSETTDKMVDYLKNEGVKIKDARITTERGPDGCYACTCKSGRVFYGRVREQDLAAARKLGFREK